MKRSIELFALTVGMIFLLSSCNEDSLFQGDDSLEPSQTESSSLKRNCGLSDYKLKLESDPTMKKAHDEKLKRFNQYSISQPLARALCSNPTALPVAVHYQNVGSIDPACLKSLAQTQIAILNQDYQGSNSDINTWNTQAASFFPNVTNGETCLSFVIADQNHPSGYNLTNGQPAVTINQTSGDDISDFSGYINIIVRPDLGFLGYSPLGGAGNGDGVVVDANAFGAGSGCGSVSPNSPYNLGRTLTHELGHYLLLDHIWGGGCSQDDDVADTPGQDAENYGCPNLGITSCGSNDLHMNYMDYTDDACMYMFSNGQSTRMENFVASNLQNVISKGASVISGNGGGDGDDGDGDGDDGDGGDPEVCESPTDAAASNLSETTATVSWTAVPDAIRYRIRYKAQGGAWMAKSIVNPTINLSNLIAATPYTFQIRTKCPAGWTSYGQVGAFETSTGGDQGGGDGNTTTVKLKLKLDNYGAETTWELVKAENYETVKSGGPYQNGNNGQIIKKTWNLEDGEYIYFIDDSYGDGICCSYGNGYAKIQRADNSIVAQSDGNFGFFDYLYVTVDNGNVSFRKEEKDEAQSNLARKAGYSSN